jgi:hypothetical protein
MHKYDKSTKWMIQHHGDTILDLAELRNIATWTPRQAEPVQPRRLPDGLLEVQFQDRPTPSLVIVEVSTYPYSRLARQAAEDALLVYLEHHVVPGVVALVLHPRGKKRAPTEMTLQSDDGLTSIHVTWKIVELWKVPAQQLLAAGDVGLIPWVPLARFDGPPEPILQECKARIQRDAKAEERENLLVVTHNFAALKYNDPQLLQILGRKETMNELHSPILREIVEEHAQKAARVAAREAARESIIDSLVAVLTARFETDTEALRSDLKAIQDDARLKELLPLAATCPDLASFRKQLPRRRRRRT